jgi:hypothetical protein
MDISGEFVDLSGSFAENLILLLIAISLTGFLIPLLLKRIDAHREDSQTRMQAELARQDKVIDAQAAVLDTLAGLLWDYQRLAAEVLAAQSARLGRPEQRTEAVRAYDTEAAALLGKLRAAISTLLRLAPRANYEEVLRLFTDTLLPFDDCLGELMRQEASAGPAGDREPGRCAMPGTPFAGATGAELGHYLQQDLGRQVDQTIAALARGMGLTHESETP